MSACPRASLQSILEGRALWRATTLRKASLMTKPRTPPSGFCNATILPSRMPAKTGGGSAALAICPAAHINKSALSSSSVNTRRCSAVQPDGPGAALRRPPRTLGGLDRPLGLERDQAAAGLVSPATCAVGRVGLQWSRWMGVRAAADSSPKWRGRPLRSALSLLLVRRGVPPAASLCQFVRCRSCRVQKDATVP